MRRLMIFLGMLIFICTACAPTIEIEPTSVPDESAPQEMGEEGLLTFYSDRDGNPEIYTVRGDGSDLKRLTDDPAFDDSPAISPDGSQIVFLSARNDPNPNFPDLKYELYVMNSDGSDLRRLTETDAAEDYPTWSPDGNTILFDADYNGDGFYEIYTMNADGANVACLTNNDANDQFADWSPDGSQIAFSSDRNGNWDIFIMNADGSNQQALTNGPDWELFPAWSPDGGQIAFNGLTPGSRNTDVYLMESDGSDPRKLTDAPGFDENPAWSPDGSKIAFQTQRDGNFEIFTMNQDGSEQQPLVVLSSDELWPSWSVAVDAEPLSSIRFEKSSQIYASVPTWKLGLADLDADGDLDAAFANAKSNESEIWLNDGSGFFTNTGQELGKFGHGIDIGDVDGDGDPDVVISTHSSAPTRVYLNDGNAVFSELERAFHSNNIGYNVDLFDLDGDGDLDAVGEDQTRTNVFWNDGSGHFTASDLTFPLTTGWGDLDGDGDVDVLIKANHSGYSVQLNDGQGHFVSYWETTDTEALEIGGMAFGDIDQDGDLDAVITSGHHASSAIVPTLVFMNDGAARFEDSGQQLSPVQNAGVSLGDLDSDGDLDLVLTDYQNPCQIWLNDGSGQFSDSGFRFGGDQFYRHAILGDLDGDGDPDIFLPAFGISSGPNEIWFNQDK